MKKGIISALSMLTGVVAGAGTVGKIQGDKLAKSRSMSAKHMALFLMMNQWVKVKQEGESKTGREELVSISGQKRV